MEAIIADGRSSGRQVTKQYPLAADSHPVPECRFVLSNALVGLVEEDPVWSTRVAPARLHLVGTSSR